MGVWDALFFTNKKKCGLDDFTVEGLNICTSLTYKYISTLSISFYDLCWTNNSIKSYIECL